MGLLAAQVIRGKDPATTPFQASTKVRRTVNLDNARRYSVAIPEEWIKKADVVLPAGPRRPASRPERNEGTSMDCQISRSDDVALVVIIGSLDSSWSNYLSERFDEVVRSGAHEVRVDMSGVSYLSSNGIGAFGPLPPPDAPDRRAIPDRGRLRGGRPRAQAHGRAESADGRRAARRCRDRARRPPCVTSRATG